MFHWRCQETFKISFSNIKIFLPPKRKLSTGFYFCEYLGFLLKGIQEGLGVVGIYLGTSFPNIRVVNPYKYV